MKSEQIQKLRALQVRSPSPAESDAAKRKADKLTEELWNTENSELEIEDYLYKISQAAPPDEEWIRERERQKQMLKRTL